VRIAAVGDLHFKKEGNGEQEAVLDGIEREADLLILAGDLTDTGLPQEMEAVLNRLRTIPLPILAVLGNHDHEHDCAGDLVRMMEEGGIRVLDGSSFQLNGVGFAGVKGFCGGFGDRVVQPFGERLIKDFVESGKEEAARLGKSLADLHTARKVAILHYSPIEGTLAGEPREIYAFLGACWLGDEIDRYGADLAVHGHAHGGSPEGRTPQNIPVYNVSRFVQSRTASRPYRLFEL
jgi:hypothetical protein